MSDYVTIYDCMASAFSVDYFLKKFRYNEYKFSFSALVGFVLLLIDSYLKDVMDFYFAHDAFIVFLIVVFTFGYVLLLIKITLGSIKENIYIGIVFIVIQIIIQAFVGLAFGFYTSATQNVISLDVKVMIGSTLSALLSFSIAYYSMQKITSINEMLNHKTKVTIYGQSLINFMLSFSVFYIVISGLDLYLFKRIDHINTEPVALLSVFIACFSIVLLVRSNYNQFRLERLSQQIQNDTLQGVIEEVKGFWHNYSNLFVFASNVIDSEIEEYQHLKGRIASELNTNKIPQYIQTISIENHIIKLLIAGKMDQYKEHDIRFIINSYGNGILLIAINDLIEILGEIFDNAIQAAIFSNKIVIIDIHFEKDYCRIRVSNDYNNNNQGKALKYGNSHNMGLNRTKLLVKKTRNSSIEIEDTGSTYVVTLLLSAECNTKSSYK